MKLINADQLEKRVEEYIKVTPLEKGERDELRSLLETCLVSPADLLAVTKEMELKAVMVLEKVKEDIATCISNKWCPIPKAEILHEVENAIKIREFGLDLGKAKEIREKAAAWEMFYKKTLKLAGGHLSKSRPRKVALEVRHIAKINKESMEYYLAQAELEAEKGDKPNDE